jgi:hypothetical protein
VNDRGYADGPAPRRRRAPVRHDSSEQDARWSPLLGLQQTAGNSAVSSQVQRDVEPGKEEELPPTIKHPATTSAEPQVLCFSEQQQEVLHAYADGAGGVQAGLGDRPPNYAALVKSLEVITKGVAVVRGDEPGDGIVADANGRLRAVGRTLASYLVSARVGFDAGAADLDAAATSTEEFAAEADARDQPVLESDVADPDGPAPIDDAYAPRASDSIMDEAGRAAMRAAAGSLRSASTELRKSAPNLPQVVALLDQANTSYNEAVQTVTGGHIRIIGHIRSNAQEAAAPVFVHTEDVATVLASCEAAVSQAATDLRHGADHAKPVESKAPR